LKETLIQGVTAARSNPVRIGSNSGGASWEGKDPEKRVLIGTNAVDYDYLETMKMELKSGRNFSESSLLILQKIQQVISWSMRRWLRSWALTMLLIKSFSFMGISGRIVGVFEEFPF